MTNFTLNEIKESFHGSGLYIALNEDGALPQNIKEAVILADGYHGSSPAVRPVNAFARESIIQLIDYNSISISDQETHFGAQVTDPLWKTNGYEGPARRLQFNPSTLPQPTR